MKALTEQSVKNYHKLLKHIIDIPLLDIFLSIGVELVELDNDEPYIHYLIEEIQEQNPFDDINALNMKLRQLQDFYNDCIASYEKIDFYEPEKEKLSDIEKVLYVLFSFQDLEENDRIVVSALVDAVETVAFEYGFVDVLDEMDAASFRTFLKNEVFCDAGGLYINYISMLDMRDRLLEQEIEDEQELYAMALMLVINLSMFNLVRKERFVYEQEQHKKVGRNDPCPCGSGKKYKKCCSA